MKTKTSVGIALCRIDPISGRASLILVKKRLTYAFTSFVLGTYNPKSRSDLIGLFSQMTLEEKRDILSLNYTQMWYRIWGHSTVSGLFMSSKTKFEAAFLTNPSKLAGLIGSSTTTSERWEIPKGRKKTKLEYDMNCAVREFQEETSIPKTSYRILPGAVKRFTHEDNGVRYETKYFIALASSPDVMPKINMGVGAQVGEVSEIRWVDIEMARALDPTGELANRVRPILRYVKKHYSII